MVIAALAGLLVGVSLNALADALPPDEFGVRRAPRRARCAYCGAAHSPPLWLALAAFLFRRGECEHCGAPRRLRAVVVELVSAVALAYLAARFDSPAEFLFAAFVVETLLLVTVIDVEHRLILRAVIYPAAALALIGGGLLNGWGKTLAGGLAGFGAIWLAYLSGWLFGAVVARVRRRRLDEVPMGWGDVNLAGFLGLAVGWPGIILALFIAIVAGGAGALIYLAVMLLRRRYSLFSAIPYGPFLALGGLLILVWGHDFAAWYLGR